MFNKLFSKFKKNEDFSNMYSSELDVHKSNLEDNADESSREKLVTQIYLADEHRFIPLIYPFGWTEEEINDATSTYFLRVNVGQTTITINKYTSAKEAQAAFLECEPTCSPAQCGCVTLVRHDWTDGEDYIMEERTFGDE